MDMLEEDDGTIPRVSELEHRVKMDEQRKLEQERRFESLNGGRFASPILKGSQGEGQDLFSTGKFGMTSGLQITKNQTIAGTSSVQAVPNN